MGSPAGALSPEPTAAATADHRSGSASRVLVLVRPGCHLCDDALEVVARVCRDSGVGWASRDITGDAELTRRYTNEIPVTFVDGQQHDFWRVDERRLRAALARSASRPG